MHFQNSLYIVAQDLSLVRYDLQFLIKRLKYSPLPFISNSPMKFKENSKIPAKIATLSPSKIPLHFSILWSLRRNTKIVKLPNVKNINRKTIRQLKANTLGILGLKPFYGLILLHGKKPNTFYALDESRTWVSFSLMSYAIMRPVIVEQAELKILKGLFGSSWKRNDF